jgi:hypothetical protein
VVLGTETSRLIDKMLACKSKLLGVSTFTGKTGTVAIH